MSERLISKENLAAYERWEGISFDTPKLAERKNVVLPTADEVEALQQRAHDEGFAQGLQEAKEEVKRLAATAGAFTGAVKGIEADLADALLTLSLDLAQRIIRQSLAIRPELVLPVVQEALRGLAGSYQNNILVLNPADAELVSRHAGEDLTKNGWRVVVDERIEAGGCRVESNSGEVDATLEKRWKIAMANLGRSDAWIV
ncbi:MAG: flagellar assembly protein FliH [Burkholderiaceae bacterium]